MEQGDGMVIELTNAEASPWDSDQDSNSDTSMPEYKRGKHSNLNPLEQTALQEILQQGMTFSIPDWQRKQRNPSILVLADTQLENWLSKDKVCTIVFKRNWNISRWVQAVRTGDIRINCNTVVLYLESTRRWNDVPPIKNALHNLSRAIKHHAAGPRVFISNHLPRMTSSPITVPIIHSNFALQQAVRSVCRAMGGVFELSIHEHFVSKCGNIIKPVQRYIDHSEALTTFGCMVFRECMFREVGIKGYWFGGKTHKKNCK